MTTTVAEAGLAPTQRVAAMLDQARELTALDWSEVEERVLVIEGLQELASLLGSVTVAIAGRLARSEITEQVGWASAKDYLTSITGGHKGSGPALVRLAERLEAMPATADALRAGWLSLTKAQVIAAKVASLPFHEGLRLAAEADLLESAGVLDATELQRTWPQVLERIDPDGALLGSELSLERLEEAAHRQRTASFGEDGQGGGWMRVSSTAEDIAVVKETLLPLAKPVISEPGSCGGTATAASERSRRGSCPDVLCAHDGSDPRDHGARVVDALVDACRRLQATSTLPETHGAPVRLMVTTSIEQLRADTRARVGGELLSGLRLSVAAVRRLACSAEVIPVVLGGGSVILDAGRAQRLVTAAIWLLLVTRDRHCAFPGCRRLPQACDAHHVQHWADGGHTSLANLVLLCGRHHRLIHTSPWKVRVNRDDGRPEFKPPPGRDGPFDWIHERPPRHFAA